MIRAFVANENVKNEYLMDKINKNSFYTVFTIGSCDSCPYLKTEYLNYMFYKTCTNWVSNSKGPTSGTYFRFI